MWNPVTTASLKMTACRSDLTTSTAGGDSARNFSILNMKSIASIQLNRADMLTINSFKSFDETRYVLNGVHFQITPTHVTMAATDGRCLGVMHQPINAHVPVTEPVEFIVNFDLLRSVRGIGKGHDVIRLNVEQADNNKLRVSIIGQHEFVAAVIEGNYPAWKSVTPTTPFTGHDELILNEPYLAKFMAARNILTRNRKSASRAITFRQHGKMGAVSVFMSGVPEFYGILMPMNLAENNKSPFIIPEWMKPAVQPKPETTTTV